MGMSCIRPWYGLSWVRRHFGYELSCYYSNMPLRTNQSEARLISRGYLHWCGVNKLREDLCKKVSLFIGIISVAINVYAVNRSICVIVCKMAELLLSK